MAPRGYVFCDRENANVFRIYMYNVHEIVHDRLANWYSYPVTQTTRESVI